MKVDLFTRLVLTVIAAALVCIVARDLPATANAEQLQPPTPVHFEGQDSYRSLARNRTFKKAVGRVVENNCTVAGASITC